MAGDVLHHPDILDIILGTEDNVVLKNDLGLFEDDNFTINPKDTTVEDNVDFSDEFWKSFLNLSETSSEEMFSHSSSQIKNSAGFGPNSCLSSTCEILHTPVFSCDLSNGSTESKKYNDSLSESFCQNQPDPIIVVPIMQVGAQEVVITSSEDQLGSVSPASELSSDSESSMEDMTVSVTSSTYSIYDELNFCKFSSTTEGRKGSTGVIRLNEEEKRLFMKEGLTTPRHLPLTKQEEKDLKRIRRKIRNKQSAQDSRKRKKQYVDGLESRVRHCTAQNAALHKRVQLLEKQNISLLAQLKQFQVLITGSAKPAKTSTCVMVLLLSFTLLVMPNIKPLSWGNSESASLLGKNSHQTGYSRTLLHTVDSGFNANHVSQKDELFPDGKHNDDPPIILNMTNFKPGNKDGSNIYNLKDNHCKDTDTCSEKFLRRSVVVQVLEDF